MKTKRLMALAFVLALVGLAAANTIPGYSSGATGLSATQANQNIPFTDNHSGGSGVAFQARHVLIRARSTSANSCHFDLGDGVATTADTRIEPGASVSRSWDETTGGRGGGWDAIGIICASGQTATWDVDAWR